MNITKKHIVLMGMVAGIIFIIATIFKTAFVVYPGTSVLHLRLGKPRGYYDAPGLYTAMPWIDTVLPFQMTIQSIQRDTQALTKDLQSVCITGLMNYKIDQAQKLYESAGYNYKERIIAPVLSESIQAVIAQFTCEELIEKRHEAKQGITELVGQKLGDVHIGVTEFSFLKLSFSEQFIKSVENKQIAMQQAIAAKHKTDKIKEKAQQQMKLAEAEAYALKVKEQNITPDLLELMKIEKWDGKLPKITGGVTPFIKVDK